MLGSICEVEIFLGLFKLYLFFKITDIYIVLFKPFKLRSPILTKLSSLQFISYFFVLVFKLWELRGEELLVFH